jgi:hypothetical protein
MNILWHTWEPGLTGNFKTSGGGGAWTSFLWDYLSKHGNEIYAPHHDDEKTLEPEWEPKVKIDVAVFCWRWRFPNKEKYKERNLIFERQNRLISWCVRNKTPFMVHDQDLKMTEPERDYVRRHGGIIATPSLFPESGEIMLHYPNPYPLNYRLHKDPLNELVYIGNNYERLSQMIKLVTDFSKQVTTVFYGNWVEESDERSSFAIRKLFPNILFPGRLPQNVLIDRLRESRATVLLHKMEYGPRGFMTIRWAEAAAAGTIPFIPAEFKLPELWSNRLQQLRVSNSSEMLWAYKNIRIDQWEYLMGDFRLFIDQFMTPHQWIIVLERLKNHDTFYT